MYWYVNGAKKKPALSKAWPPALSFTIAKGGSIQVCYKFLTSEWQNLYHACFSDNYKCIFLTDDTWHMRLLQ